MPSLQEEHTFHAMRLLVTCKIVHLVHAAMIDASTAGNYAKNQDGKSFGG
jgi:hypothetical protein